MAVTAPKKIVPPKKPDRGMEWIEVVQVSRRWLRDRPETPRTWSGLLRACSEDETGQIEFKRVLARDRVEPIGPVVGPIGPVAWFRQGPNDLALLYQQGWTD